MITYLVACAAVIGVLARGEAHADVIVAQGVELQVPPDWAQTTKGAATILVPKKYKGRAIEVITLKAMPAATPEAFKTLFGSDKLEITGAKEVDRDGVKALAATGKLIGKKSEIGVDVLVVPLGTKAVLLMSFVGADQDPLIRKANGEILASARIPGPRLSIKVTATKTTGVGIPQDVITAITKIAAGLDARTRLPRAMPIKFEDCGIPNAHYKNNEHSITMCHELNDYLLNLFTTAGMDKVKAQQFASDTVLFTFFHEFGHALVGELALPITGKGEDAADELATLILANAGPMGHKAALHAAAWFDIQAKQPGKKNIFWDTHSFDEQRVVTITCLLYGADKAQHAARMKLLNIPPTRLAKCTRDYPLRKTTWDGMMKPFLIRKK